MSFVIPTSQGSFEFPLSNADACNAIVGECPQERGEYIVVFPVELAGVPPGEEATVRVQINNQAGQVVACGAVFLDAAAGQTDSDNQARQNVA